MLAKSLSVIVLDIKTYEETTNLDDLAEKIFKTVCFEGLCWNSDYKISPIAFGLMKLIVKCTINDNIISVDQLIEEIINIKASDGSEIVHSADLVSIHKI